MQKRKAITNMRNKIVSLYGEKTLRKSAMNIRGGAGVFKRLLNGKGFRTALEIGTYKGCAAAEMAQYVDRVITIDLKHGKLETNGDKWDRKEFWKSLGVENVELVLVADNTEKAAVIKAFEFDFAFIDGAHDASVKDDFAMVKKCGNVLFHDADDNGPGRPNCVYEFLQTLPKDQIKVIDIFAYWQEKQNNA